MEESKEVSGISTTTVKHEEEEKDDDDDDSSDDKFCIAGLNKFMKNTLVVTRNKRWIPLGKLKVLKDQDKQVKQDQNQ